MSLPCGRVTNQSEFEAEYLVAAGDVRIFVQLLRRGHTAWDSFVL